VNNKLKIFLSLLILVLLYACASSSSKEVLNIFFDGVTTSDSTAENTNQSIPADSLNKTQSSPINKPKKPVIFFHVPYEEKMCDNCHDSKYSNKKVMELPELCYQCHTDFRTEYDNLHYPIDSGECNVCHHPHQAMYSKLLLKPIGELCEECHDVNEIISGDLHEGIMKDECMDCHNPHGSNDSALMK